MENPKTPKEIYALPVIGELKEFYEFQQVFRAADMIIKGFDIDTSLNDKIILKVHFIYHHDFRRFWRLSSLWFDNKPFAVVQQAGREGDDHKEWFVTDSKLYIESLKYILSLANGDGIYDLISEDSGMDLCSFYGHSLKELSELKNVNKHFLS